MANDQSGQPTPRSDESFSARRAAFSAVLMLLLVLLILLLIAAATERTDILKFAGMMLLPGSTLALQPRITDGIVLAAEGSDTKAGPGAPTAAITTAVDPRFRAYYDACGGVTMLGLPISAAAESGGRVVQWFERARLELPADGSGDVQRARIGAEYTAGIPFPEQVPFADRPATRFFSQTRHGISAPFLQFWDQAGGVAALGYPISDQLQEITPNGVILTVQYFERGRLEAHPQHAGTPYAIQIGLVGRSLFLNEARPNLVPLVKPTAVAP